MFISSFASHPPAKDFYEIKIYTIATRQQEERVETFLRSAYLPALHRAGIAKVGVYKPVETDTTLYGKRIFVFIPFSSLDQYSKLGSVLDDDKEFQTKGVDYLSAAYDSPPYARMESILLQAFPGSPQFQVPVLTGAAKDRVYELRSYEGPTEKIFANKVQMFNKGDEIGLFKRLGFNAVFYASVLSGARMPNLMYMTSFNTMASRDEHWKAFGADPQWKTLSSMPEYQHNVSKSNTYLLHPAEYSEL
jgi:NIPSNAP